MKKLFRLSVFGLIFITVIFIAILLTAFFERDSRLKIVCSPFTERKSSSVNSCVANPFRDKTPEQTAENLLQSLKNNQTDAALPYLRSGSKEPEKDVGREKDILPVLSWRIINREIEKDGRYRLSYVYKQKDFDNEIPMGFYFTKNQEVWVLDEVKTFW